MAAAHSRATVECMCHTARVLFLTTTFVMTCIATALRDASGQDVRVARRLDDVPALLDGDAGGVLVLDAAAVLAESLRPLLARTPGLTCIAIDFAERQAVTICGRRCPLTTLEELAQLIKLGMESTVAVPQIAG